MPKKTYDMYCAVARALEVLGERWTLLVVRELLTGPKRYADLQAGLPGIASNMLTERLRTLLDEGVITQRTLAPPAASTVYDLTERGRGLKPVLLALGTWGLAKLGVPREGEQFRLAWLMIALDSYYDAAAVTEPVAIALLVGGESLTVRANGPEHQVTDGAPASADITVRATRETFLAWATGRLGDAEAVAAGLEVTPAPVGLARLRQIYKLPA